MKTVPAEEIKAIWQTMYNYKTSNKFDIIELSGIFKFTLDYSKEDIISQERQMTYSGMKTQAVTK